MNMLMYFLLSLGWLITGIVNITRHAHWTWKPWISCFSSSLPCWASGVPSAA